MQPLVLGYRFKAYRSVSVLVMQFMWRHRKKEREPDERVRKGDGGGS